MTTDGVIQGDIELPDPGFDDLWKRIVLPEDTKNSLVFQIILELKVRGKFPPGAAPLHGLILLAGPPGTGKTSLARAAASKAASALRPPHLRYIEVEPHSLTGSTLGKSQRAVQQLMDETLPEFAAKGPTVVLLDEVETLAASRYRMSLEANPIDVHRATDALLAGLDRLASREHRLVFIATTNFEEAVDPALISRADFVMRAPLPNQDARKAIIADTLAEMARQWPALSGLQQPVVLTKLAALSEGMDGRRLRKAILQACATRREVALDPAKLTVEDLVGTFRQIGEGSK